jgi:hypothetical protein
VSIKLLILAVLKALTGMGRNVSPMEECPVVYAELVIIGMATLASYSVIHLILPAPTTGSGMGSPAPRTLDLITALMATAGTIRFLVVFIRRHKPLAKQIMSGTVKTVYPRIRGRSLSTVCPVISIISFLVVVFFSVLALLLAQPVTSGTERTVSVRVVLWCRPARLATTGTPPSVVVFKPATLVLHVLVDTSS